MNFKPISPSLSSPSLPPIATKSTSSVTLDQWATRHKIEKNEGVGILDRMIRISGLIASSIFLSAFIPLIALFNLGIKLKEKYSITYQPDTILPRIRSMKAKEEKDKLSTMQKVLDDPRFEFLKNVSAMQGAGQLTETLASLLTSESVIQHKGARHLLRHFSSQVPFNPTWIKVLQDREIVHTLSFSEMGVAPQAFIYMMREKYPDLMGDVSKINWKKIALKVEKEVISAHQVPLKVRQFQTVVTQLLHTLKTSTIDFDDSTNKQFIADLRKVLRSSVYQALKEDSSQPVIQLLHRFASDMWNKAPSVDAYRDLGEKIIQETKIEQQPGESMTGLTLAQHLADSHQKMEEVHWSGHGVSSIFYSASHPSQTMGSLASEGGAARHIPGMVGLDEYDSHGTLSNNPSLQGITTMNWGNASGKTQTATVHNCYGGSPTIGDHEISPEFEAAIQAAENNQLAPDQLRDLDIPMMVNYNNLQNLDKTHGEGPRSRAIMLLNKKYPLSFTGATFAKDSDLYLMKKKGSVVWQNPPQFGEKILHQLKRSFDPNEKGHGFYFQGSLEEWEPIFKKVIENATEHFEKQLEKTEYQNLSPADLQGAYQEYVYSLLNAVNEMRSLKTLVNRGISNPSLMAISACKENIDRGGMENTKYMYTRLPDTKDYREQRLSLLMGVMHSRALSARDRVILKARLPQTLNFMKVTEPHTYRENQAKLFEALGYSVTQHEYHPAISRSSSLTQAAGAA